MATVTASAAPTPRRRSIRERLGGVAWGTVAWFAAIIFFFPVFWMVLTSFKSESAAYTNPPKLVFHPTLDQYKAVFSAGMGPFLANSAIATVISVLLVLLLATPAAYALSMRPVGRWRDALFFFISTKMLPVVAAIVPIYLAVRDIGMLDSIPTLIVLYTAMNLPIAVWMMRSFFHRGAERDPGGGPDRRRRPAPRTERGGASRGGVGNRGDGIDLRDFRLERILLRPEPDLDPLRHDARVPGQLRDQ